MVKVGIYGASGYTGQELIRLLCRHPDVQLAVATSRRYEGKKIADIYPSLMGSTAMVYTNMDAREAADRCDLVFLALPHGVSMSIAPIVLASGKRVIDLSADFRLHQSQVYEEWYGRHEAPEILDQAVYGLPELHRDKIHQAQLIANPGCYPTAALLGLSPLLRSGWIDPETIVVDSKSGASGAGREPQLGMLFGEVHDGFKAYKIGQHRHLPEMEQEMSLLAGQEIRITFTPHLLPLSRGILSTIYVQLRQTVSVEELWNRYRDYYRGETFIRLYPLGQFPNIGYNRGSNFCDIGVAVDRRTGRAIVVSAIDNLVKGASGQAVQNMNILLGLKEGTGLEAVPLYP